MTARGNRGFGARLAQGVLEDTSAVPAAGSWRDDWTDPAKHRDRSRRWLSMWLKSGLASIPPKELQRYLAEMSDDVEQHGFDVAVDRFIDKTLPAMRLNGGPALDD